MAITAWSAKVLSRAICLSVERADFRPANHDRPDGNTLAQQRHGQDGSNAEPFGESLASGKLGLSLGITSSNMDGLPVKNGPASYRIRD